MSEWPSEGPARSGEPQLRPGSRADSLKGQFNNSCGWKQRPRPQRSPDCVSHVGLDQSLNSCQVSSGGTSVWLCVTSQARRPQGSSLDICSSLGDEGATTWPTCSGSLALPWALHFQSQRHIRGAQETGVGGGR